MGKNLATKNIRHTNHFMLTMKETQENLGKNHCEKRRLVSS